MGILIWNACILYEYVEYQLRNIIKFGSSVKTHMWIQNRWYWRAIKVNSPFHSGDLWISPLRAIKKSAAESYRRFSDDSRISVWKSLCYTQCTKICYLYSWFTQLFAIIFTGRKIEFCALKSEKSKYRDSKSSKSNPLTSKPTNLNVTNFEMPITKSPKTKMWNAIPNRIF